jgi:hypothetical protein
MDLISSLMGGVVGITKFVAVHSCASNRQQGCRESICGLSHVGCDHLHDHTRFNTWVKLLVKSSLEIHDHRRRGLPK